MIIEQFYPLKNGFIADFGSPQSISDDPNESYYIIPDFIVYTNENIKYIPAKIISLKHKEFTVPAFFLTNIVFEELKR